MVDPRTREFEAGVVEAKFCQQRSECGSIGEARVRDGIFYIDRLAVRMSCDWRVND